MNKVICVYSSSSFSLDNIYFENARMLGNEIASRKDIFLFGGGLTGLMGTCAKAVHENGGKVVGIIPEALNVEGIVYTACDELHVTTGMRERKALMDHKSDAFIALPGGYGTLEELLEIITLKQLRYHNKPVVILNTNNYYNELLLLFDKMINENFAKSECKDLYFVTKDVCECLDYIDSYVPFSAHQKWLTHVENP